MGEEGQGGEDDFAAGAALFGEGVGFGGVGEGHDAVDGEFEFAVADGFSVMDVGGGVGLGHEGVDLDGGVQGGVGGRADDAAEVAAGFDLGDEPGADGAADGVGYGVDDAEPGELVIVIDVDGGNGAEGDGLVDLLLADAYDDFHASFNGGVEGDAADAAEGSAKEDGLAGLGLGAAMDELVAGDGDEGNGGSGGHVEGVFAFGAVGNVGEFGGLDDAELGVGGVGNGEDAVAFLETFDPLAEFADDAGEVSAKDAGEGHGETLFGSAGAHLPVDGVEADGLHADEHFAGARPGVFNVFKLQFGWATVFVEDDCFHCCTSER